jgi:hypothetical protein
MRRKILFKCFFNRDLDDMVDEAISESQLKMVLDKLDAVKLEILRLRAQLLPEEKLSEKERKELEKARKQITEGYGVNLEDFIKEDSREDF